MKEVKVYVGFSCSSCTRVKAWLKDRNVEFEEVGPVEGLEYLSSKGIRTVPYTVINGEGVLGFNPAEMEKLLKG